MSASAFQFSDVDFHDLIVSRRRPRIPHALTTCRRLGLGTIVERTRCFVSRVSPVRRSRAFAVQRLTRAVLSQILLMGDLSVGVGVSERFDQFLVDRRCRLSFLGRRHGSSSPNRGKAQCPVL